MSDLTALRKCSTMRRRKNGRVSINCKVGFWSVSAPSQFIALKEALHYFRQYRDDGEYDHLLN